MLRLAALAACVASLAVAHRVDGAEQPSPAQVAGWVRGLQSAQTRPRLLEQLQGDPAALRAAVAGLRVELDKAVAERQARKADPLRERVAGLRKQEHDRLVAQKRIVGGKHPTRETRPAFLELVQIHQRYFAAVCAWQELADGPVERRMRELVVALTAADPAAQTPDLVELAAKDLADDLRAFTVQDEARWQRAKQIYLFNETMTSWAADHQRTSARAHNGYRLIHGLVPFEVERHLCAAAQGHAEEMAKLGYFAHESPVAENRSWNGRIRNAGYPGSPGSENLAMGSGMGSDEASMMQAVVMWFWDPHHHPLINAGFDQLGTGAAGGRVGSSYGATKSPQSAGLDVSNVDLAKLIRIDYRTYASAFGGEAGPKRK